VPSRPPQPKPGDKSATKPVAIFGGHATEVMALAFSADGRKITSVSTQDVRFWQAESGEEIAKQAISWSDPSPRPAFAIGPEGATVALVEWRRRPLATGFVANLVLISATSGRVLMAIDPHGELDGQVPTPEIHAIAFSPDGKHLVSAGGRQSWAAWVKIFDATTRKELRHLGEVKQRDLNRIDKFIPPDAKVIRAPAHQPA